jgi:RND family efflux transporter MFP subunit
MKKRSIARTLITIVILIGSIALIGWVLNNNKKKNAEKTAIVAAANGNIAVRTSAVQKQSMELDFGVNGNFIPGQQMNFAAENSGRVTQVLVDEGSVVTRGQTLAIIKTDQLNVDLESAQANYRNALKDKDRYENAFKTGGVTQQQLDQASLALDNAEARVAQAKIKIGDAYIRASINGVVNKRYIEPGAVVASGTQLFELVDISRLKLQVTVNESQVANLKVGDKVQIKVSVFPDKDFAGTVSFIAAKADNTLSFPIEISLAANPGNQVKAGMYGTAIFNFPSQAPAIMIPRSAFIGSVSSNQVFVIKSDNTASLRKVVAGRVLGDKVEVLQGLEAGENVITSGQINLNEGSPVTVVK